MDMAEKDLPNDRRAFLANQISKCQKLIRDYAAEHLKGNGLLEDVAQARSKSTVSQRDIQRVFKIYGWLKQSFSDLGKYPDEEDEERERMNRNLRALFVALAVVYYFRLNATYRKKLATELNKRPPGGYSRQAVTFNEALRDELKWTIDRMKLPQGVAKTEGLKENIYAIVICTMTRIPLIIVGQPGSSKTLSFKIVTDNLQGQASVNSDFKDSRVFKALDPHFYQCSRKSSSNEIKTVFEKAIIRQESLNAVNENRLCVVMMDEAGLPEQSHESLKVLHYFLDDQKVAFVGISNHVLDAAKMNRAISLFSPDASQEDVEVLAKGCLISAATEAMGPKVEGLSKAYLDVMRDANMAVSSFFGLRDFIYFCVYLRRKGEATLAITPQMVTESLERNFNGSRYFENICQFFLKRLWVSHLLASNFACIEGIVMYFCSSEKCKH